MALIRTGGAPSGAEVEVKTFSLSGSVTSYTATTPKRAKGAMVCKMGADGNNRTAGGYIIDGESAVLDGFNSLTITDTTVTVTVPNSWVGSAGAPFAMMISY